MVKFNGFEIKLVKSKYFKSSLLFPGPELSGSKLLLFGFDEACPAWLSLEDKKLFLHRPNQHVDDVSERYRIDVSFDISSMFETQTLADVSNKHMIYIKIVNKKNKEEVAFFNFSIKKFFDPKLHRVCFTIGGSLRKNQVNLLNGEIINEWPLKFFPHNLQKKQCVIGSAPASDICINLKYVSSLHCKIIYSWFTGTFWIRDFGSLNGTMLNALELNHNKWYKLNSGDKIMIPIITRLAKIVQTEHVEILFTLT